MMMMMIANESQQAVGDVLWPMDDVDGIECNLPWPRSGSFFGFWLWAMAMACQDIRTVQWDAIFPEQTYAFPPSTFSLVLSTCQRSHPPRG